MSKCYTEHVYREWESRKNVELGHVFNVLYPENKDSLDADREMIEFFLKYMR